MKTSHLHDLWESPDNSRLTTKQFSFRLPIHIGAKIAALCEMYPQKNRTQILADLLTSALDDLEKSLPEAPGEMVEPSDNDEISKQIGQSGKQLYYLGGVRGRFHKLANLHFQEDEKELGNENPPQLYKIVVGTKEDFMSKNPQIF
jgi:hypothetical protein